MTDKQTKEQTEPELINLDSKELQPKKAPWKRARLLDDKKQAEHITAERIFELINKFDNSRDKALFALTYLTAGRIGELVRTRKIKWGKKEVILVKNGKSKKTSVQDYTKKKVGELKEGIKKEDVSIGEMNGIKYMRINLRNLKNKQKGYGTKEIPIPLEDEGYQKFADVIFQYLQGLEDGEELFPIGKSRAEKIISKVDMNPHFIRKVRLTHLVQYHNFSDQKLKLYAGWSDSRPSKHYIRIGTKDLLASMTDSE